MLWQRGTAADTQAVDNTRDLQLLLASNHSLLYVRTAEETRALGFIRAAAHAVGASVWLWSMTEGLRLDGGEAVYQSESIDAAIEFVRDRQRRGVFVFRDAGPALRDDGARRRLREAVQSAAHGQTIVVMGAAIDVTPDLADLAHEWQLRPPSPSELEGMARRTLGDLSARGLTVAIGPTELRQIVQDLSGLSMNEAERALQRAAMADGRVDVDDLPRIRATKAEILSQEGILELIESPGITLEDVGGLDTLKNWLEVRRRVFVEPHRAPHLDVPRGLLLTGVPGCGKSLVAKATASSWQLPLVLLDPARMYGKYVGESEQRLDETLRVVDTLSPAILWIDEVEKGFSSAGEGDGGVSARVLGTFLRWLQERDSRVFLIATSNDVRSLPPELLRRGRLDEIFFVDVPSDEERHAILAFHLSMRGQDPATFDLRRLADASDGFSGAELETAIVAALYQTFASDIELTTDQILREIRHTVPLTVTRSEEMNALRAWAQERARVA